MISFWLLKSKTERTQEKNQYILNHYAHNKFESFLFNFKHAINILAPQIRPQEKQSPSKYKRLCLTC